MDVHVKDVMQECTKGSDEERLTFPEVVMKLMEVGVEQYHLQSAKEKSSYKALSVSDVCAVVCSESIAITLTIRKLVEILITGRLHKTDKVSKGRRYRP